MSDILLNKYKVENCFYGEFSDMLAPEKGWFFDSSEPRYLTNYIGLRNRLAILNENYVYADFKSRVNGCYCLIKSLTEYINLHKDEIKIMLKAVDLKTINRGLNPAVTDSFAVEYKVRPVPSPVTIKTYEAELVSEANGRRSFRQTDRQKTVTIPYYIDYYPVKSVKLPFAYIIDISDPEVIGLLRTHGIKLEKLETSTKIIVDRFNVSELIGESRLNQGHYTNTIKGNFIHDTIEFQSGTVVVRMSQPLANVVAYLLEPQSNDGLMTWNYLDRYLVPQWGSGYNPYPVYKVLNKVDIKTVEINK
jgi:hypothetical protein